MTYKRSQVVSYSNIYLFSPLTFVTPPPGLRSQAKLIIEPFSIGVWMSILLAILFIILVQRVIVYKVIKNRKFDITWPLISCLLRQGKM